jgi:hypothetical protein
MVGSKFNLVNVAVIIWIQMVQVLCLDTEFVLRL